MKEEGTTPDEREELNKVTSRGRRIDRKEGSSLDGKGSRGELVFFEEAISEETSLESVGGNVESSTGGTTGMMRRAALRGILSLIICILFEK